MLARFQAPNQGLTDRTRRPGDQNSHRASLSSCLAALANDDRRAHRLGRH
jgi:hypothetical protein